MGYGDEILAAGQAQRLYDADPSRRVAICDMHRQPRWHDIWAGNPIVAHPKDVAGGEPVQRLVSGLNCRPYIVYPFTAHTGWMFNKAFKAREHVARIYLTPAERGLGLAALAAHGPYVLIEPWSKHENLRWPLKRWAELVAACPDVTFVQHTHRDTGACLVPGARYEPTTSFREACGLLASASLYIRGESGMCHAAAALGRPQVTLWGGCMDWDVLGGYPKQIGLVDRSEGSPCGRWHACAHCAAAMERIRVEQVADSIRCALRHEATPTLAEAVA